MGFLRVEKTKNYVVMNKTALHDDRLSWKAKGIIAYMLSMPDDWKFYIDELIKHSTDGESSFRSGLKELKDRGYVNRYPIRNDLNKIVEWETVVSELPYFEKPVDGKPVNENPHVEKPHVENRGLLSINELNNDSLNNNELNNNIPYAEIIEYLNQQIGTNYKPKAQKTQKLIRARFNEGHTVDDFKKVIRVKVSEWASDEKMKRYIRPETLFSPKFEGYLNQEDVSSASDDDPYNHMF